MNYQDLICLCIGIPDNICKLLDKIEKKFQMDNYFDIHETFIKELIKYTIDEKGLKAGNMLIQNLYDEIINHTLEEYADEYPKLEVDLFKTWVDGYTSELWFNGKKVESKEQLDKAIKEWSLIKPKFYVYAGYYEIYVSTKPMDTPRVFQSWHWKIERALQKAKSYDVTIHYCENIREYFPDKIFKEILDENNQWFNY